MPRHAPTFLILLAAIVGSSWPAGGGELTLRQATTTALERNRSVAAASARASAAHARQDQAKGYRLPKVDLMEVFNYTDNPAEVFAFTLNQRRFDMDDFFRSDPNRPDALDTWITRLEFTQPIYVGGKISTRNEQASLMAASADKDLSHTQEKVAFDVATAYANTLMVAERLEVVRRARETTAAHVALAEKYAAQGFIIDAEVLNAQVHLARMDEMLVESESNADLAQSALAFTMGIDQTTRDELQPLPSIPPMTEPMVVWMDRGVTARRDLEARRRELDAGRLEEKAVNPGFKPEIAVKGRYELYDDQLFGSNGHSGSVMAVAKINLFNGGSDMAEIEAARQEALSGEHNIAMFSEGVRLEVRSAFAQVQTAKKRHLTTGRAVDAAREALRVREKRFEQGLDKMIDLLDAETALRESELRKLVARYDLVLSAYRLYFTSGTSLTALFGTDQSSHQQEIQQ
ncbi:MAG: TolC family protein [Thermoanaerobaculales bacterium]|nr:TolC family protein [Thermoanaerobaculales bacterium]